MTVQRYRLAIDGRARRAFGNVRHAVLIAAGSITNAGHWFAECLIVPVQHFTTKRL
ncbi:hypothetical protein D3C81_1960720 [compost metagenome]